MHLRDKAKLGVPWGIIALALLGAVLAGIWSATAYGQDVQPAMEYSRIMTVDAKCSVSQSNGNPKSLVLVAACQHSVDFAIWFTWFMSTEPTPDVKLVVSPPGIVILDPDIPMPPAVYTILLNRPLAHAYAELARTATPK